MCARAYARKSRRIEKTRRLGMRYRSWIMARNNDDNVVDGGWWIGAVAIAAVIQEGCCGKVARQRASTLKPRSIPTIVGISLRRPFVSVDTTDSLVLYALGIPRFPFRSFSALNPTSAIPRPSGNACFPPLLLTTLTPFLFLSWCLMCLTEKIRNLIHLIFYVRQIDLLLCDWVRMYINL